MKFVYAILATMGWLWLALVLAYLFLLHPWLQRPRRGAQASDLASHHEE